MTIEVLDRPEHKFGGRLYEGEGMNMSAVRAMFVDHTMFPGMCRIRPIKGPPCYMDPTAHQIEVGDAYEQHKWNLVGKYRHAFISSYAGRLMARDAMYLAGRRMVILANKDSVAEDILERFIYSYKRLPPELQVPMDPRRSATKREIRFIHGGWIQILSAKADDPGEGLSPDLFHITEWGITGYAQQKKVVGSLLPIAQGKPDARVLIESTFGVRGDIYFDQWKGAWEGDRGQEFDFNPVFLKWWTDPKRHRHDVPAGFEATITERERELLRICEGMTYEHLQFRRNTVQKMGDARIFDWKYPAGIFMGWKGTEDPAIPPSIVEEWSRSAVTFSQSNRICWVLEPPVPGREYVVFADPASFGRKGDYSGLIVMDAHTRQDVAEWEGRAEPGDFADRLVQVSEYYNNAEIVVERNAGDVLGALGDHEDVYFDENGVPGWYASAASIRFAVGCLINQHRNSTIRFRSKRTVGQLGGWDGSNRGRRTKDDEGNTQHYELARCAVMAAAHFEENYYAPAATPKNATREAEEAEAEAAVHDRRQRVRARAKELFGVGSAGRSRKSFAPPRY